MEAQKAIIALTKSCPIPSLLKNEPHFEQSVKQDAAPQQNVLHSLDNILDMSGLIERYFVMVSFTAVIGMLLLTSAVAISTTQYCNLTVSLTANPVQGIVPLTVNFSAQLSGYALSPRFDWWFGDGSHIIGGPSQTYTYHGPWTYNVVVRVLDTNGCWSQASATVTVSAPAQSTATVESCTLDVSLSASPSSGSAPLQTTFLASASGATGSTEYDWWFGDGSHLVGNPTETYTYQNPWTYNVVVRVLDSKGCWSQSSATIVVSPRARDYSSYYLVTGVVAVLVFVTVAFFAIRNRAHGQT